MKWLRKTPKKLRSAFFRLFGSKARIALNIVNATRTDDGSLSKNWVRLDLAGIAKKCDVKPKKVHKIISQLRKHNLYETKKHGEYVKPTPFFANKASRGVHKYLSRHKDVKNQIAKDDRKSK